YKLKNTLNLLRHFDWTLAKKIFENALPVLIMMLFSFALARVDQLMIMSYLGEAALGQFAVAVKLIDIWQFLPMAVINSLFPSIVQAFGSSSYEYNLGIKRLYFMMLLISLSCISGVYLLGDGVISVLYGEQYKEAIELLKLYSWVTIFTFFIYARTKIFTIESAVKYGSYMAFIAVIINIVLNTYLIPAYGAQGAIYSSLLAYGLSNFIFVFFVEVVRVNAIRYITSLFLPLSYFRKGGE
ncbi:polysaccharide biosynthesis C-terminal domain-containing protein, partial [Bacteriovoracaceae bacterium]|nr:polysaccharide biosynthesis C-terminal domain-containing protein [Bacteriovoracaceae bacterium]